MTVIYPPQNYIPTEQFDERYWMCRLLTPIWRHCFKGHHDSPFHVEVEGEIGPEAPVVGVLWTCSTCGYRYPPGMEPEALSIEWHRERLEMAFAFEADDTLTTIPRTPPLDPREMSTSALRWWEDFSNHDDDDED